MSIYVQLVHLSSQQSISIDDKNLMIENEEQNDRIENLLNQIQHLDSQAIQSLTEELSQQGFAILNTQGYAEASVIKKRSSVQDT